MTAVALADIVATCQHGILSQKQQNIQQNLNNNTCIGHLMLMKNEECTRLLFINPNGLSIQDNAVHIKEVCTSTLYYQIEAMGFEEHNLDTTEQKYLKL
eukprot:8407924-Ditylum_brightwellii.AAC.1